MNENNEWKQDIENHYEYEEDEPLYENKNVCKKPHGDSSHWVTTLLLGILLGSTVSAGTFVGYDYIQNKEVEKQTSIAPVTTFTSNTSSETSNVSSIVENAMPSIVSITITQKVNLDSYYQFFGYGTESEVEGAGSGIIIGESDTELLILTNNHVVADSNSLNVSFIDGETVDGVVKGTSPDSDLAVVAVSISEFKDSTINAIKVATMGNSGDLKVGDEVIAIGNALGYGQSVTKGIVSALDKEITDTSSSTMEGLIQTDAAINPGNSGGALLNAKGELIGVNVAKLADTTIEGIGFAIPITDSTEIIEEMIQQETRYKVEESEQGYLQIRTSEVSDDVSNLYGIPKGVYIQELETGGVAESAGIEKGDVIVELAGHTISNFEDLKEELQYHKIGETVSVKIKRQSNNWEELEFSVQLGEEIK